MMSNGSIQSVTRAMDVLELYSPAVCELSVKEISYKLGLAKSTVHGLIKTLVNRGYLEQNPENQKYKLGLKLFELGQIVTSSMDIRKLAYPILQKLSAMFKETVHLVVWNGKRAVYIEKIDGNNALRMSSQIGRSAMLHCTGVGKSILAFLAEPEQDAVLSDVVFTKFTPRTISDIDELDKELQNIKKQGYAVDDEEIEMGLKCVAAPIMNYASNVVGSISCSGQKQKLDELDKNHDLILHVKLAAMEISKKMGFLGA